MPAVNSSAVPANTSQVPVVKTDLFTLTAYPNITKKQPIWK
jgi:hypothetical protein